MFQTKQNQESSLWTGLALLKVWAINPTANEFAQITGREVTDNMQSLFDYSEKKDKNDNPYKNVSFLVGDKQVGYHFKRFMLYKSEDVTKDGKKKFVSTNGNFTYYVDDLANLSEKYTFNAAGARVAFKGEEELIKAIKSYIKYDEKSPTPFLETMEQQGCSYKNIYTDARCLTPIFNWADKEVPNSLMPVVFAVEKVDGKNKQRILSGVELYVYNSETLKTRYEKKKDTDYPLVDTSKYLFTFKLQEFAEADCVGEGNNSFTSKAAKPDTSGW